MYDRRQIVYVIAHRRNAELDGLIARLERMAVRYRARLARWRELMGAWSEQT